MASNVGHHSFADHHTTGSRIAPNHDRTRREKRAEGRTEIENMRRCQATAHDAAQTDWEIRNCRCSSIYFTITSLPNISGVWYEFCIIGFQAM